MNQEGAPCNYAKVGRDYRATPCTPDRTPVDGVLNVRICSAHAAIRSAEIAALYMPSSHPPSDCQTNRSPTLNPPEQEAPHA